MVFIFIYFINLYFLFVLLNYWTIFYCFFPKNTFSYKVWYHIIYIIYISMVHIKVYIKYLGKKKILKFIIVIRFWAKLLILQWSLFFLFVNKSKVFLFPTFWLFKFKYYYKTFKAVKIFSLNLKWKVINWYWRKNTVEVTT